MSTLPADEVRDVHTREHQASGARELTRLTVNLTPRAVRALEEMRKLTGHSMTDTVSRAAILYAYIEKINSNDGKIYIQDEDGGELSVLRVF